MLYICSDRTHHASRWPANQGGTFLIKGNHCNIQMRYEEFEDAFSSDRMSKYVTACNGDTRRSMMLYRCNLRLSQEMFTLISCFEVTLRNRIDRQLKAHLGGDWLRDASCLAVCYILMHVLIRRAKSSTMLIENSSANIVTTILNCSPKWSSAFGNTSTQMFTMLWLARCFCKYFPTNHVPPVPSITTIPTCFQCLTVWTTCATVLLTTNPSVSTRQPAR